MNDFDIVRTLERLPLDEPPYVVPVGAIVTAGRRARLRRRVIGSAGAAFVGVAAIAALAPLLLVDQNGRRPAGGIDTSSWPATPSPAATSSPPAVRTWNGVLGTVYYYPAPGTGIFGSVLDAVRGSSPDAARLDFQADNLDGDWRLDGNVDDGQGPARLFVTVSRTGKNLEPHPCNDPEFTSGATCTERTLSDGAMIVRRGPSDHDGYIQILVVLRRGDGVSVTAEAGNYEMTIPTHTARPPAPLKITRGEPVYTTEQLVSLVQAVDRSVQQCLASGCDGHS